MPLSHYGSALRGRGILRSLSTLAQQRSYAAIVVVGLAQITPVCRPTLPSLDFSTSAIPAAEYPVQFPVIGDGCETHEIRYRRLSCHG